MNEALNIIASNAFEATFLSTLRRLRGDTPAANEDACVNLPGVDGIEAWARRASGTNGFGDAMLAFPMTASRPTAYELHQNARAARSQAIAGVIAAALVSMHAALRRALASYRTYRATRETVRALRGLDDRTLHDLGYHRSEIESVAIEVNVARQLESSMKIARRMRKLFQPMLRARVFAAFAKIATVVDERTAHRRTQEFFRSSGAAWTRSLG